MCEDRWKNQVDIGLTHTEREKEYDKQLFLLFSLLAAIAECLYIYVCVCACECVRRRLSSFSSFLLYEAMCVSFHCCRRSLAHSHVA